MKHIKRCEAFSIKTTKDSWYITDPNLQLGNGEPIPTIAANGSLCYLGGQFSPWTGLQYFNIRGSLQETLKRLRSTPLKLHQKLHLLSTYIIPISSTPPPSPLLP
jgi:hypothetical protein